MPEYRKHKLGDGQWHSSRNCPDDPKSGYKVRLLAPARPRDPCPWCVTNDLDDVFVRTMDKREAS